MPFTVTDSDLEGGWLGAMRVGHRMAKPSTAQPEYYYSS